MEESQVKVPTIVSVGIICLLVGVGIGVVGRSLLYEGSIGPASVAAGGPSSSEGGPSAGMSGGGPPGGGAPGMPGGGPGGGPSPSPKLELARTPGGAPPKMGGGQGPSPKIQLALLVTKLDLLSQKPLAVSLDESQKKTVQKQLQGLEAKESLSDEDAKARLDALLDVLKDQKETLEAAGYRWPGQGGFRPPADTPNPFKDEKSGKALKSLQDRLAK